MKVLATKADFPVILTFGIFIIFLITFSMTKLFIDEAMWPFLLTLIPFYAVLAYYIYRGIRIIKLPKNLIWLEDGNIFIYDGQKFAVDDVADISYCRSRKVTFGTIKFIFNSGVEKDVDYVEDIEEAGKAISKVIYKNQNDSIEE